MSAGWLAWHLTAPLKRDWLDRARPALTAAARWLEARGDGMLTPVGEEMRLTGREGEVLLTVGPESRMARLHFDGGMRPLLVLAALAAAGVPVSVAHPDGSALDLRHFPLTGLPAGFDATPAETEFARVLGLDTRWALSRAQTVPLT